MQLFEIKPGIIFNPTHTKQTENDAETLRDHSGGCSTCNTPVKGRMGHKKQIQTDPAKKTYWSYLKQAKFREIEPYWPSLSMEVAESINRVILGEDTQDELEQLSERISRIRRAKYEKE